MRTLIAWLVPLALACDAACGGASGSSGEEVPGALREMDEYAEVTRFTAWQVEGLELYRAAWAVPDRSSARIVGVDGTGQLVEGPELMRRFGELPPGELATRAFGVLMDEHGNEPLSPGDEHEWGTEAEWAVVTEPRVEDGALVFYAYRGEMDPALVQHRVDLSTFEPTTKPARQVLVDRGEVVVTGGPLCVAVTTCGCWDGCVRAELVQVPEGQRGTHRPVEGDRAGTLLAPREECREGVCFQVCRADRPDAHCDPGALAPLEPEECDESCPPSEAPYHCELVEDGCRRVEHPLRTGSAPL